MAETLIPPNFLALPITDRFDLVRFPTRNIGIDQLPPVIPRYVASSDDCADMFKVARDNWSCRFDKPSMIEKISNANPCDQATYDELKAIRIHGLILRGAYSLFSTEHLAPGHHHYFIKALGNFKDKFSTPGHDEAKNLTLQTLDTYPAMGAHDNPNIATLDSFNSNIEAVKKLIMEHLGIDRMSFEQLHVLRKDGVRNLMQLHQIAAVTTGDPKAVAVCHYLRAISTFLGDLMDSNRNNPGSDENNHTVVKLPQSVGHLMDEYFTRCIK